MFNLTLQVKSQRKENTQMKNGENTCQKREIGAEPFVFLLGFLAFFALFISRMGVSNTLNTMMNTAYALLMDTVLYLTAICVLMGAVSALLSEFGVVALLSLIHI